MSKADRVTAYAAIAFFLLGATAWVIAAIAQHQERTVMQAPAVTAPVMQ